MEKLTRDYKGRIRQVDTALADAWSHDDAIGIIRLYRVFIGLGLIPPDNFLYAIDCYFKAYLEADGRKSLDMAFGLHKKPNVGHPLDERKSTAKIKAACFVISYDKKTAELKGEQPPTDTVMAGKVIAEFNLKSSRSNDEPCEVDSLLRYYRKYRFQQSMDALCSTLGTDSEFIDDMLKSAIKTLQATD